MSQKVASSKHPAPKQRLLTQPESRLGYRSPPSSPQTLLHFLGSDSCNLTSRRQGRAVTDGSSLKTEMLHPVMELYLKSFSQSFRHSCIGVSKPIAHRRWSPGSNDQLCLCEPDRSEFIRAWKAVERRRTRHLIAPWLSKCLAQKLPFKGKVKQGLPTAKQEDPR